MRHSRVTRFVAALLIALGISPFTAPFATFDLTSHNSAVHGWKAPTDPDDAVSMPEPADALLPLFSAVELAEAVSVDQLPTHRLLVAVLRI